MNRQSEQLTDEDIHRLVAFLIEDYGTELDKIAFTELMLQMLEDVPGVEMGPQSEVQVVDAAYAIYSRLNNERGV